MFSSIGKGLVLFIFCIGGVAAQENTAPPITAELTVVSSLSALPAKCITLTQGRECFATITLTWQAPKKGNYCIYQVGRGKAVDCWSNEQKNLTTFEFESSKTMQYQLVAYDHDQVVAQTSIEVSWVHKASPRKRRWRLF